MKLPAAKFEWKQDGMFAITVPKERFDELLRLLRTLKNNQIYVELGKPKRPRTTGEKSQNHALNGAIQPICEETGNDFDTVKAYVKNMAISLGYPFDTFKGKVIPWSESRTDTVQCRMLIDCVHRLAAELSITLKE